MTRAAHLFVPDSSLGPSPGCPGAWKLSPHPTHTHTSSPHPQSTLHPWELPPCHTSGRELTATCSWPSKSLAPVEAQSAQSPHGSPRPTCPCSTWPGAALGNSRSQKVLATQQVSCAPPCSGSLSPSPLSLGSSTRGTRVGHPHPAHYVPASTRVSWLSPHSMSAIVSPAARQLLREPRGAQPSLLLSLPSPGRG